MARRTAAIAVATLGAAGMLAAVAITATANAGTSPAAAPAVDTAPPAGVSAELFAALQRDLKLSPAQAKARLAVDHKASQVQALFQAAKANVHGGTYLAADGAVVVNVTTAAAVRDAEAQGAKANLVRYTEAQLDSAVAKLDRARAPKSVVGWYTDVKTNSVVVLARANAVKAAKAFASRAGLAADAVRVEVSNEAPRPFIDVIGGAAYNMGGGGRCSVGFSVNGGFVTAGHCGRTGTSTSNPSGSFAGSSFPGNDYAWVRVAAGNTPRPLVRTSSGNITVSGSTQAAVGASVCRSGSTTGYRCGTIHAFNSSVTYPQGTVSGLIRTNVCAEPGDSGGSLIAGTQAQGMTSGGSGNCSSGGTTYFQPVNEALQVYSLTLLTGSTPPGPGPTTRPPGPGPTTQPPGGGTWAPGVNYSVGAMVTYGGASYRCQIGHRSMTGWEPPNTPALWVRQ